MTSQGEVRRLALACPQAVEADHHGIPSFRVAGRIFCTLNPDLGRMMVKLDAEDQRNLTEAYPGVVEAVPGYWGRKGSTFVWYERADAALIETLLGMGYANVTTKRARARR